MYPHPLEVNFIVAHWINTFCSHNKTSPNFVGSSPAVLYICFFCSALERVGLGVWLEWGTG